MSDFIVTQRQAVALIAPVLAGGCAQLFLFGILVCTFVNFVASPAWRATLPTQKLVVLLVMTLITVETAFCVHDLIFYGVTTATQFSVLGRGTLTECLEPALTGLIGALTQLVLASRALRATNNPWIRWGCTFVFGSLCLLEVLAAISLTYFSIWYHKGVYHLRLGGLTFSLSLKFWMWFAACADVVITGTYVVLIIKRLKRHTETGRNVMILILRAAIQSASYTAGFAILAAASEEVFEGTDIMTYDIPYAFWLPLASLYGLSLFCTLSIGDKVASQVRYEHELTLEDVENRFSRQVEQIREEAVVEEDVVRNRVEEKEARLAPRAIEIV
ncbi:hypothetical protein T439DRAFT_322119 [Meredithblackwellia eburnea MCA 4105]